MGDQSKRLLMEAWDCVSQARCFYMYERASQLLEKAQANLELILIDKDSSTMEHTND